MNTITELDAFVSSYLQKDSSNDTTNVNQHSSFSFTSSANQRESEVSPRAALKETGLMICKMFERQSSNVPTIVPLEQPLAALSSQGQLVRCIGMVQDLSDTPMLLQSRAGSFFGGIVHANSQAHGNTSGDPSQSAFTQLIEAHQAYIVPIPGGDYSFEEADRAPQQLTFTHQGGTKRREREEVVEEDVDTHNDFGITNSTRADATRGARADTSNLSSPPNRKSQQNERNPLLVPGATVTSDHTADGGGGLLNFPTAAVGGSLAIGCVATYLAPSIVAGSNSKLGTMNGDPSIKINQIVECFGFIVPPPISKNSLKSTMVSNPTTTYHGNDETDNVQPGEDQNAKHYAQRSENGEDEYFDERDLFDDDGGDDNDQGFRYERLSHDLAPRLVCVAVRPIDHPLQLDTQKLIKKETSVKNASSPAWCAETRALLLDYIATNLTAGDSLLAEYLLLHVVSTVDFWHGGSHVPVGDVPLRVLVPDVQKTLNALRSASAASHSAHNTFAQPHRIPTVVALSQQLAKHLSIQLRPLSSFGSSHLNLTKGLVSSTGAVTANSSDTTVRALQRGFGGNYLTPTTVSSTAGATSEGEEGGYQHTSVAGGEANALFEYAANLEEQPYAGPTASPAMAVTVRSLMPYKDNRENAIVAAPLQLPSHHHLTISVSGDSQSVLGTDSTTSTTSMGSKKDNKMIPNANSTAEDDLLALIHKQHTFVDYVLCKVEQPADVRCVVVAPIIGSTTTQPNASTDQTLEAAVEHNDLQTIAPLRLACTVVWEPQCLKSQEPLNQSDIAGSKTGAAWDEALPPLPTRAPINANENSLEESIQKLESMLSGRLAGSDKVSDLQQLNRFRRFIDFARRPLVGSATSGETQSPSATSVPNASKNQLDVANTNEEDEEELVIVDDVAEAEKVEAKRLKDLKLKREAKQTEETLLSELVEWQQAEPELFNHDALLHNNTLSIVMSLSRAYARSFGRLPRSLDSESAEEAAAIAGREEGTSSSLIHDILHDFYQVQKLERARYLRGVKYGFRPL